jgi:hypothetical protein
LAIGVPKREQTAACNLFVFIVEIEFLSIHRRDASHHWLPLAKGGGFQPVADLSSNTLAGGSYSDCLSANVDQQC